MCPFPDSLNRFRPAQGPAPAGACGGFTLLEVLFASTVMLVLFLALFETLLFCRRSAADLRCRIAADALAYDVAWEVFNRKTTWFDRQVTADRSAWYPVPPDFSSSFPTGTAQTAVYNLTILRQPEGGGAVTHWRIITDVRWPRPSGGWGRLAQPYAVDRYRAERNLFRTGL